MTLRQMFNTYKPIGYTKKLIKERVSATVVLMACASLCISLLVLTPAPFKGKAVATELAVIVGGLTTIVSIVYVRNKKSEDTNNESNNENKDNPISPSA